MPPDRSSNPDVHRIDSELTVGSDQHEPLILSGQPGSIPDFRSGRSSVPDRAPRVKDARQTSRETMCPGNPAL